MTPLTSFWGRIGIGIKLSLSNFILIAALVSVLISVIGYAVSSAIEQRAAREMTTRNELLKDLITTSDQDLHERVQQLAQGFQTMIPQPIEVTSHAVTLDGITAPLMFAYGETINSDNSIVDSFTKITDAVATIFVKSGDDYIRISTSLLDQHQNRHIGTKLEHSNPAYAALSAGEKYMGLATLFGREYMTHYTPLKDDQGEIIGATFIGIDFSNFLTTLKGAISEFSVGETGYYYVLNSAPGPQYGELVTHPTLEGQNVLNTQDANGRSFIKELMELREGTMLYPWQDQRNQSSKVDEKMVAFTHYAPWEWIIVGGTYTTEYTKEINALITRFALLGLIILLVVSALWYGLIQRMIVRPITRMNSVAETIATGDLTAAIQVTREDEIGQLMGTINKITRDLTRVVAHVRTDSYSVAAASSQIAQANVDLSARTENQASALSQTAASMEELEVTVRQNADSASTANQLATQARNVAERGGQVVADVVDTMQGINTSSHKIAEIVSVIDGIAFQTNILALNAAVEAARAGQHGRGFAVVATEVRSLSARSATAAQEIRTLIDSSVQQVENGTALVHRAGTTMSEIVSSIRHVTDIMNEISAASLEQQAGVGQIAQAVNQMDQATQQNAALVEQMTAAANSLRQQSDDLVETVSVFRIEDEDTITIQTQAYNSGNILPY